MPATTPWGTEDDTGSAPIDWVLIDATRPMSGREILDEVRRRKLPERKDANPHLSTLKRKGFITNEGGLWFKVQSRPSGGSARPAAPQPSARSSPAAPPNRPAAARPEFALPDEVKLAPGVIEGALLTITVNAFERDPKARQRCIDAHGTSCAVCGLSMGAEYGSVADGYIHVHHLRPLSEVRAAHAVDPVADLRPVCPNCHAVIHLQVPPYSIDEVRAFRQ